MKKTQSDKLFDKMVEDLKAENQQLRESIQYYHELVRNLQDQWIMLEEKEN